MWHRDTNMCTHGHVRRHPRLCVGVHTCIPAHGGTQTPATLRCPCTMRAPTDCWVPPDPAPPKQPPPAPVKPVSGQDKRPPLPDQDENYVIPIADAPAANYVNEDGGWGTGAGRETGVGGEQPEVTRYAFVHAVLPPGRPVILKPKRLAKVQAKPPKPPVMPKPGRGPSSQPLPHPTEGQPQLSPPSPSEPRGLNGGPARKPAGSSAQALFPTTGKGPGGSTQGGLPRTPHSEEPGAGLRLRLETPHAFWTHFHLPRALNSAAGPGWMWGDGTHRGSRRR